jgi:ribosome assembly protein 1
LQLKSGEAIDPNLTLRDLKPGQHITRVKIDQLFLLMGRELETLDSVPAGNVLGEFNIASQITSLFIVTTTRITNPSLLLSIMYRSGSLCPFLDKY